MTLSVERYLTYQVFTADNSLDFTYFYTFVGRTAHFDVQQNIFQSFHLLLKVAAAVQL